MIVELDPFNKQIKIEASSETKVKNGGRASDKIRFLE